MKRLSSYAIYLFLPTPLFPIFILVAGWDSVVKRDGDTILGLFLFCLMAIYMSYILLQSKRAFYKEGKLYVYELFANKMKILDKDHVGAIETFFPFSPTIWRVVYYDNNMDRKLIFFIRNVFCNNFADISAEF